MINLSMIMQVKENTRREIESKLEGMGDYVKMDYLSSCLKKQIDFDTRKFVLMTLAGIYEKRSIYVEAGKLYRASAEINTTTQSKINDYLKSCNVFIRAGEFDEAEVSFNRALSSGNEIEKKRIKETLKEYYTKQAKEFLKRDKRKHAMDTYERLLTLDLNLEEKKLVKEQLLDLYHKLGKVREYLNLKKTL